jgi:hypothetical protein
LVDGPLIITGSFAVEWQIDRLGGIARPRRLNDLDVVVPDGITNLRAGAAGDLLIHHFHPTRELGNVLIQLVDPRHRLRIDIFSARTPSIVERSSLASIGGVDCRILSAEDLTARLLAIVNIVCEGRAIDPKYWQSLQRLTEVADPGAVSTLWPIYRRSGDEDLDIVLERVRAVLAATPGLLQPHEYETDIHRECQWCVQRTGFPLAAPDAVFALLGHA